MKRRMEKQLNKWAKREFWVNTKEFLADDWRKCGFPVVRETINLGAKLSFHDKFNVGVLITIRK